MELHKKLKLLRIENNLTQKEIALLLQTSTQYYRKYEKGKHPITVAHLKTLCTYYGVSSDELLEIPPSKKRLPDFDPQAHRPSLGGALLENLHLFYTA